jgi:multicomponent Na+:H+ antiporter subunit F
VTGLLIALSVVIGVVILMALVGIVRGPTAYDRILATSLAVANSVALLAVIGFVFDRPGFFFDIGLGYALLAFLFPLAFARFLANEETP